VNGEVICKNSEVSGTVEGKITVHQLLILKVSSKIFGDIVTSKLSIEPGAIFSGNCKMSDNETNGGAGKGKEFEKTSNKGFTDYARYTGIAAQMGVIIFLTTWEESNSTIWQDSPTRCLQSSFHYLGVFAAIYTAIKDFLK